MFNLFTNFFSYLNKSNFSYAITGRTENYPTDIHSDIDIIIPSNQINDFWKFMNNFTENGIDWVQVISHETVAHYCVISLSDGNKHEILKPDVCTDYYRKAILFLKADFLLENRIFNPKGFYQLAPEKEFIYYLLKKIDKGNINEKQFNHLKEQYIQAESLCLEIASIYFKSESILIIKAAFTESNISILKEKLIDLKIDLHKNLRFSITDYIEKAKNRIQRILQPTGLVVAFMGPDGCGKTTIIEGVKQNLTEVFRQNKQYHLYPKESKNAASTIDPHAQKTRGFFASLLKLIYFLGLYNLGYWTKIYPQKIKSTFIIFDRYYHDILVDKKRYRNGTANFWVKFIGCFVPKPDLWILLNAPAEVIQHRKKEVTYEECVRQVNAYKMLFGELNNAFIVNANQTPEKVIYDAESVIIQYLKKRTSKRYKKM